MSKDKIELTFNKDSMSVRDLKEAAESLHQILNVFHRDSADWEAAGQAVAQISHRYEVKP